MYTKPWERLIISDMALWLLHDYIWPGQAKPGLTLFADVGVLEMLGQAAQVHSSQGVWKKKIKDTMLYFLIKDLEDPPLLHLLN